MSIAHMESDSMESIMENKEIAFEITGILHQFTSDIPEIPKSGFGREVRTRENYNHQANCWTMFLLPLSLCL